MIEMLAQAALTTLFVLVAIGIGIAACYWLLYPSKADEADETWKRTAVKETKAPPMTKAEAVQSIVDGANQLGAIALGKTPPDPDLANYIALKAPAPKREPDFRDELRARIAKSTKPDDITLAKVKRIIKKGRK